MKTLLVRFVNVLAIVGVLLGYNQVLEQRAKDDEIARLSAEVEEAKLLTEFQSAKMSQDSGTETDNGLDRNGGIGRAYADGTYSGAAEGFGGVIEVSVTVVSKQVTDIEIVSADGEDGAYFAMAQDIISEIIEKQTADVDIISGATFSSTGIKNAVAQALEEAVLDE